MTGSKAAGTALIAGALAGLVTMALHPTGHDLAGARSHLPALLNAVAHGLAIASGPALLFGGIGIARALSADLGLARLALVAYGFGLVAMMSAAAASGFIAPELIDAMRSAEPAERLTLATLLDFNFHANQAFARIYVALASAAIALWSAEMLRTTGFPRWIAIFGVLTAGLAFLGVVSGHLRLDIHGFGLVVVAQAVWLVATGARLYQGERSLVEV